MQRKILVVWKDTHRVDRIVPYLQKLATPGMTAVFLVPYPLDCRQYLRDHWVTAESPEAAAAAAEELSRRYSWEAQRELAKERLAPVGTALTERQVDLEIRLYSKGFKEAVRDCIADGDIRWVVLPARHASWSALMEERFGSFRSLVRSNPIILQDPQPAMKRPEWNL